MSIASRITSMENHIKESYQELKGLGIDINVNKNLKNIPILLDNYWETLPKVSGSGTDITLNNTKEGKMKIQLKGNTYQETTTGKNLASLKTSSSQTIAGLPFTIENGIFKVNGTASSNGGFYFDSFRANNGTATFSFEITGYTKGGSNNGSVILQVSDDNITFTNLSQQYFSSTSASVQVTLDSTKYYRIRPYFASGNVFSNSTLKIQLEYGSTKTDFEPYTNGASPNPDYPQEVQVVTGNQNIQIVKGLYPLSLYVNDTLIYTSKCSVTLDNDEFVFNATGTDIYFGNVSGSGSTYREEYGPLFEIPSNATRITIKTDSAFNHNFIQFYDSTKTFVNRYNTNTKEIPSGAKYVSVRIGKNNAVSGTTYRTKIIVYFDSQEQNYPINLGKNLINSVEYNKYVSGSGNVTAGNTDYLGIDDYTNCKPNTTYTISFEHDNSSGQLYVAYKDSTNTFISRQNYSTNRTFTTPNNAYYLYAYIYKSSTFTTVGGWVQLERGNKATSYSPYKTPIELCKIGTYQDYIYKSGSDWKIHREIGKVVLNGSENWNYRSDYNAFYLNDTTSKGTNAPLSNYFKGITSGITTNDNSVLFNTTTLYLIYHTLNGVITDLQTWLSTHNTNVYYVLATETEEQITDVELISQLNNLAYGSSYNGQTNVNSSGNIASLLNANAIQG